MTIKKVGVIGAGNMGSGIAQKMAQEGFDVVMVDTDENYVQKGMDNIRKLLANAVRRRIFTEDQTSEIMKRVQGTTDINAVRDADLVIEAIFEDLAVKKDLFSKLDAVCDDKTILASNTSSFSITELSQSVKRKDKFIGLHFFYHPAKNRLLEIIPSAETSEATLGLGDDFSRLVGKTGILVKDRPGFAVNRFFVPWLNEAARLLEEGTASISMIDVISKKIFKIGMGPFELMNATGVPIAYHSTMSLGAKLGDFYSSSERLRQQFESGEPWDLDGGGEGDEDEISARLLGVVFTIACQLVEEKVASKEDIDRGAKIGLRWSSGPFEMMNEFGIGRSYELVRNIIARYQDLQMPVILEKQKESGQDWTLSYVDLIVKDGIARIIFNKPEAMNAIDEGVMSQLDARFSKADSDPNIKAIVLEGAGKAFVAGADIQYFIEKIESGRLNDIVKFTRYGHFVLEKIDSSEKLVIAKLDGLALGGGLEIALTADVIVATPKATMAFPETGIGIYPGLGGTQRTPRYIGKELAKYLILTGKTLDGKTAHSIGLVEYLASPQDIDRTIRELVGSENILTKAAKGQPDIPEGFQEIIKLMDDSNIGSMLSGPAGKEGLEEKISKTISYKAPIAIRLANKLIDEGSRASLEDGLKMELDHLVEIFSTKDANEGLKSVVERRRPVFEGE